MSKLTSNNEWENNPTEKNDTNEQQPCRVLSETNVEIMSDKLVSKSTI